MVAVKEPIKKAAVARTQRWLWGPGGPAVSEAWQRGIIRPRLRVAIAQNLGRSHLSPDGGGFLAPLSTAWQPMATIPERMATIPERMATMPEPMATMPSP